MRFHKGKSQEEHIPVTAHTNNNKETGTGSWLCTDVCTVGTSGSTVQNQPPAAAAAGTRARGGLGLAGRPTARDAAGAVAAAGVGGRQAGGGDGPARQAARAVPARAGGVWRAPRPAGTPTKTTTKKQGSEHHGQHSPTPHPTLPVRGTIRRRQPLPPPPPHRHVYPPHTRHDNASRRANLPAPPPHIPASSPPARPPRPPRNGTIVTAHPTPPRAAMAPPASAATQAPPTRNRRRAPTR